jgi:hypothetical protein
MTGSAHRLAPGTFVRSPAHPDWGLGQVQSAIGDKVTVNFEHRGKLVLNLSAAPLVEAEALAESPGASGQLNED